MMMRQVIGLINGVMVTVLLVGPSFAGPSTSGAAPVEKPSKIAIPHRVTGNVVSVDEAAKTFTVQDSSGKEFVLTADPSGTPTSDVKAGDQVKVTYKKNRTGQMVATKVAPVDSMKTRTTR